MNNVYIVTSGQYSDYGIEAVFVDRDLAEQFAAKCDGTVQDWDILRQVPKRIVISCVTIDADGSELHGWSYERWDHEGETEDAKVSGGLVIVRSYRGHDVALKAARDKLAQWKAEQAGL